MNPLLQDLRSAARLLLRNPHSTSVAILTLALGIGLVVCIFSILDGIFLGGIPNVDDDRLLIVEAKRLNSDGDIYESGLSPSEWRAWEPIQSTFSALIASTEGTFNIACDEHPRRYDGAWISPRFLGLFDVEPLLGRGFDPGEAEPGREKVVLISTEVWTECFARDPDVVGTKIRLNSDEVEVIGVLPQGFYFPQNQYAWMPLVPEQRPEYTFTVFGRPKPGISADEIRSEFNDFAAQGAALQDPISSESALPPAEDFKVAPYFQDFVGPEGRHLAAAMTLAALAVLLLACFNVSHLIGSRTSLRSGELALRSALGAPKSRILRLVLFEALWPAIAGAPIGVFLAWAGIRSFNQVLPQSGSPPYWFYASLDARTLAFVVPATLFSALIAGLIPALYASNASLPPLLKESFQGAPGRRLSRWSRLLVVTEIAMCCALLGLAGLMVRSVTEAYQYDPNFDPEDVLIARLGLFEGDYPRSDDRAAFHRALLRRLSEDPGVRTAALSTVVPMDPEMFPGRIYLRVDENNFPTGLIRYSPGYFEALDVPLLSGRFPQTGQEEFLIGRAFSERAPLREIPTVVDVVDADGVEIGELRAVGVLPDLDYGRFGIDRVDTAVFLPLDAQTPRLEAPKFIWIILKTAGDPEEFVPTLRKIVFELDPNLPLYWTRSMKDVRDSSFFFYRFYSMLFTIFAGFALLLAAVGIYGVTDFSLRQRFRETAIRMACGATSEQVVSMILRQGLLRILAGLAIGSILTLLLGGLMTAMLFRVAPWDPFVLLAVPGALLVVSLAVRLGPAQRAASPETLASLRAG